MNRRIVGVVVFALVVAFAASAILYQLLSRKMARSGDADKTPVVVATRDLPVGQVIKDADLKESLWSGPAPAGVIRKKEEAVGRGVLSTIYQGEAVTDGRLAARGAGGGLAATIPPGKRAVAVKVNEVVGLAGYVLPGMKVDVIACGEAPDKSKSDLGTQSRTILQNIEVLSAGQNIQRDNEGKPVVSQVVNLLVSPEEAEVLSLAANQTKIQLVLRNPLDTETPRTPGTAEKYLFSGQPKAPPALAKRPDVQSKPPDADVKAKQPRTELVVVPVTMEIVSGSKKQEVKVGQTVEEREVKEGKR